MNVWIIQVGEPLPMESGQQRLWRSGLLAQGLAARGHDVLWWATTFDHVRKRHRVSEEREVYWQERVSLYLLHSPGYRRNISLSRLYDHKILARQFRRAAARRPPPDVIHCGFPTIELSLEAARYGRHHGVPVVLDVRDLWPDIFVQAVPPALRPLARTSLFWESATSRQAFRLATAISGITPGAVDFGLGAAGRAAGPYDRAFAQAYPQAPPTPADAARAREWWEGQGLEMSGPRPVICFFGGFGEREALDLPTVLEGGRLLHRRGLDVRLVLCGDGPRLEPCRAAAADVPNVALPGWVDYPRIWTLMRRSLAGLLPYLPIMGFEISIPNKAIEYLSGSLPIVTSLAGGYLDKLLREHACGCFYEGGNPAQLADAIERVLADSRELEAMRLRARGLYESQFTPDRVYHALADYLEELAQVASPEVA